MDKTIKINEVICIGCGTCVAIAPKTFKMNDAGKAEVLDPKGNTPEEITDAIQSCAVSAISLE